MIPIVIKEFEAVGEGNKIGRYSIEFLVPQEK
jgi:hypothetical protein